jgi:hypothetical protein
MENAEGNVIQIAEGVILRQLFADILSFTEQRPPPAPARA